MTKPEPARHRTTNWKSCNDAPKRRGSLLVCTHAQRHRTRDPAYFANLSERPQKHDRKFQSSFEEAFGDALSSF